MSTLRRITRSMRTRVGPWAVWIGTMVAVVLLYADVHDRGRVLGFAYGIEYKVAAPAAGRIKSVAVEIGQTVTKGSVIAILDGSRIDANIREYEAKKRKIKATIAAKGAEVRQQMVRTARNLDVAIEQNEVSLSRATADHKIKSAELKALSFQRTRLRDLVSRKLAPVRNLSDLEIRHAALRSQVATTASSIDLLRKQLTSARARRATVPQDPVKVAVAPLEEEIRVINTRLSHLRYQKSNLVLRAPADGQVYRVMQRPGDVAAAGQTIVRLIGSRSDRVVACVSEFEALSVRVGAKAKLHRRDMSGTTLKGHVMSMGPIVDEVPVRCRRDPRLPAWGRDVVIVLDEPAQLLPGQAFYVSIDKDFKAAAKAVAAPVPKPSESAARDMVVPDRLRAISRLEPSGLAWIDSMNRYVMVSDDTGFKGSNNHAPWLFAMDADGRMDPAPLKIHGLDSVNDLESITAQDNGMIYVLSSQSFSRKGKRKKSRQLFARLVHEGGSFRADGVVHLANLLDRSSDAFRQGLGINDTSQLDIEGMTTRNGSLLMGLKAPLDSKGRAIIWKMDFPERLFGSGDIESCGLTHWSSVQLKVKADGSTVPGGISELLALPDGTMLIGATASGINARTQDGAIYFSKTPTVGTTYARRVYEFGGLKPEGLALSPQPGRYTIVFDRGSELPSWLELPWPSH